jgi:hypothetical protein
MPPEGSAAFVAAMEDVLSVYERPYDPQFPVVCMDEASRQLIEETRAPFTDSNGVKHSDFEYVRHGQKSIFLATEPLGKWRTTRVADRRTAADWAHFMKEAVIGRYPEATKIVLVMDNLNTHKMASFYEAYPPEQAKGLVDRLEVHYTPKHGSWLDMAETELSALQNQCLKQRRLPTKELLAQEVKAWEVARNKSQVGVNWQYTNEHARTKLKRLYPVVEV